MTTYKEVEDITDSDEIISARNIVNPLIGQLEENDTIFINAIYLRVNKPFNLYQLNGAFNKRAREERPENTPILIYEFVNWLTMKYYVSRITERPSVQDLVDSPTYSLYPYYPSIKDVLWCTKILKKQLQHFNFEDIFLLALYREIEVDGKGVDAVVFSRDVDANKKLVRALETLHGTQVTNYLNSLLN